MNETYITTWSSTWRLGERPLADFSVKRDDNEGLRWESGERGSLRICWKICDSELSRSEKTDAMGLGDRVLDRLDLEPLLLLGKLRTLSDTVGELHTLAMSVIGAGITMQVGCIAIGSGGLSSRQGTTTGSGAGAKPAGGA